MTAVMASSGNVLADRRYHYALALRDEKDFEGACDLLAQTSELVPTWPPIWFALGESYRSLGNTQEAIKAFQKALDIAPEDTLGARLHLAQLTGSAASLAMSAAYVASLFDQYAERFDDHLVASLQYRGPEILLEALKQVCAEQNRSFWFDTAIDLGCGTGLMAAILRKYVGQLSGVDISPLMIEKAQKTGWYDHATCADLVPYLAGQQAQSLDLLIAADVLVYIGDLEPLLSQSSRTLQSEGLLAFTVQHHDGDGFALGDDMRFHHSETYLRETAIRNKLTVELCHPCVTRFDAGKPVAGLVLVVSRAADSHDR